MKDVLLTGTGVWILVSQALSPHPSDPLLVVAMGLCAPAIYDHAKSLVGGPAAPATPPAARGTPWWKSKWWHIAVLCIAILTLATSLAILIGIRNL